MRSHASLLLLLTFAVSAVGADKHVIDIGAKDDTPYAGEGMYGREGPYPKDRHGDFHAQPFRWARNNFSIHIPTFAKKDNAVVMHMKMMGGDDQRLIVECEGTPITILRTNKKDPFNYEFIVPASIVGKRTTVPLTFRAALPRKPDPKSTNTRPLFCAVAKVTVLAREPATDEAARARQGISVVPCENSLYVNNGQLALWFGQPSQCITSMSLGMKRGGILRIFMVQFEEGGVGYKGTGVYWIPQERVKRISHEVKDGTQAVVTVTVEHTQSRPARRKFEADVRVTVCEGQTHFQAELVRVKNTDKEPYKLRGYYFKLQSFARKPKSLVVPDVAAWIGNDLALGAVRQKDGDFAMAFRRDPEGKYHGEITRKLDVPLKPGEEWKGREPAIIIFATDQVKPEEIYREAIGLRE